MLAIIFIIIMIAKGKVSFLFLYPLHGLKNRDPNNNLLNDKL